MVLDPPLRGRFCVPRDSQSIGATPKRIEKKKNVRGQDFPANAVLKHGPRTKSCMADPPIIGHSESMGAGRVEIRHRKKRPVLTVSPWRTEFCKHGPRSKSCMADPPTRALSESIRAGLVEIRHGEKSTVLTANSGKIRGPKTTS